MNREKILEMLSSGQCEVKFRKVDGTERTMHCTRDPYYFGDDDYEKKIKIKENENIVRVYDLDLQAWRSFRVSSVISIENLM